MGQTLDKIVAAVKLVYPSERFVDLVKIEDTCGFMISRGKRHVSVTVSDDGANVVVLASHMESNVVTVDSLWSGAVDDATAEVLALLKEA